MCLEVDRQLENTALGVCIEASSVANCVPLKFVETALSNIVIFKRKLVVPETGVTSFVQENNMAVVLQMADIVHLVIAVSTLSIGSSFCLLLLQIF